jgi:hypothetical protein
MHQRLYQPAMSDLAVTAKTGKNWRQWFAILDKAGAAKLGHKGIVKLLGGTHRIGPWWRQMVSVEYERARGLRVTNQTTSGFSVSISRTLGAASSELFEATADAARRREWFPRGRLKISSLTEAKYFRAGWNGARLEINFYDRPAGKAQIVVQVNRLKSTDDVEYERALWKKALVKLETALKSRCSSNSPPGRKSTPISSGRRPS